MKTVGTKGVLCIPLKVRLREIQLIDTHPAGLSKKIRILERVRERRIHLDPG